MLVYILWCNCPLFWKPVGNKDDVFKDSFRAA